MPEAISTQQRIVPGAPPPAPLSKTQKKKRKTKTKTGEDGNNIDHIDSPATPVPDATASTLVDKESDATDVQTCSLAPDVVVHPEPETPSIPDELKPSPIVELVNKRLKTTTKKIARMTTYAATDPEKLNDDQKRTLKTLPTLEAIQKELGEVKKAVENYEADLAHELLVKKLEAERAERAKIAEAVAASQDLSVKRTADILDLLRLRSHLALGELDALPVDETEGTALLSVADALLGDHEEKRQTVINGFLRGTDGFDGISYARLVDIIKAGLAPPHAPTPPLEEPVDDRSEAAVEVEVETVDTVETIPAVAITGVLAVAPISKGFSFVQESEIEEAPADDIEWVDAGAATQEQAPEEELLADGDVEQEAPLQEYTQEAVQPATEEPATSAPLDWATDDADLPPIASVQESIGASGSATPGDAQPKFAEAATGETDGPASAERHNEEVVAQSRGGRGGRGRGLRSGFRSFRGERGGFRGERGGFRGGERSGFHGGERGGFHGGERGGDRGGFRPRGEGRGGERGGFHGGDRGGFHGGENGEFRGGDRGGFRGRGGYRGRGDWRGDGEHRGRGRGRPRGHGGERGGAPAATTPVATEPVA